MVEFEFGVLPLVNLFQDLNHNDQDLGIRWRKWSISDQKIRIRIYLFSSFSVTLDDEPAILILSDGLAGHGSGEEGGRDADPYQRRSIRVW